MTSFIIDSQIARSVPKSWSEDCPFCKIIQGEAPAFTIYEDELVMAFLGMCLRISLDERMMGITACYRFDCHIKFIEISSLYDKDIR